MKTPSLLSLFALSLLIALPASSFAADTTPPVRKVTVTGSAITRVAPDEMEWSVQVSINDATLAKAKARHDASMDAAIKFIKSLEGKVKNLQTGGIRFEKQTFFPDNNDRAKPFTCATQFTFTLTDFEEYGTICDSLAKLDGVEIQSVNYASSKETALKREALKQALLNAREKANDLAVTAACYIDRPLLIQEGSEESPHPVLMGMARSMPGGMGTPAAVPGQIEIKETITVTYDLFYK